MAPPGFRSGLTGTRGKVAPTASASFQAASFLPHDLLMRAHCRSVVDLHVHLEHGALGQGRRRAQVERERRAAPEARLEIKLDALPRMQIAERLAASIAGVDVASYHRRRPQ